MEGLWGILGLAAGCAAVWAAGIRGLRRAGGMRDKAVFTFLMAWCAYILLFKRMGGAPITLLDFNKALMPIGRWVERMVMGPS